MVDSIKETFEAAAIREFFEEAAAGDEDLVERLQPTMLKEAKVLYGGQVDDTRSTDNSWTETSLIHFSYDPKVHGDLNLCSDDDALDVQWLRTDSELFRSTKTFHSHHRLLILSALDLKLKGAQTLQE
eukprot:TRINITY_DN5490_c0_g1_i1.p2 TRINITY_DN5490_c0_g1~~TRINITY_DN5490_c0_g1_i1.p2  ORF type:complete len:128 (+),score=23.67 TRINITY_DN5490_c0_g1_i1:599-982(+)